MCVRKSCSAAEHADRDAKISASKAEIERLLDTCQLAVPMRPGSSECTSGEKNSWRRFPITISRPKVVSSGTSGPARRLRSSIVRWST